jgi:hypothetical protein
MNINCNAIHFAGSELRRTRHVCAFFNGKEEAYRTLLPLIVDGFNCRQKAIHVLNPGECDAHLQRLTEAGIDVDTARDVGQLDLRTNTETYLSGGRFDQDRMIEVFTQMASGNRDGPYELSRIVCQMDWAGEGRAHVEDLIEFEARINDVWCRHDDVVICVYDLSKFGGDTVVDILRSHPMVVIGGILQENPFYIPPAQFLSELRSRKAGTKSSWSCSEV